MKTASTVIKELAEQRAARQAYEARIIALEVEICRLKSIIRSVVSQSDERFGVVMHLAQGQEHR